MPNPVGCVGMTAAQMFFFLLYSYAGAKTPEARTEFARQVGEDMGDWDAAEIELLLDGDIEHRIEPDGTVVFMVPVD
jgi:hypothetical protein